jgi:hypothetical protein
MVSWNVRRGLSTVVAVALLLAGAQAARAQSSPSIVGTVRDDSGAALVGVTVEVASPALIERTKVAVTGVDGTYRVVDLRAGDYSVTFSLDGFKSVRKEQIPLSGAFTAGSTPALPSARSPSR